MTAKEIIANWLKDNGFDGLINEDNECSCQIQNVNLVGAELEEFIPCEALDIHNCKPAYMWECKGCVNKPTCKVDDDACMKSEKQIPPLDIDKMGEKMREMERNKVPIVKHNDQRLHREYEIK